VVSLIRVLKRTRRSQLELTGSSKGEELMLFGKGGSYGGGGGGGCSTGGRCCPARDLVARKKESKVVTSAKKERYGLAKFLECQTAEKDQEKEAAMGNSKEQQHKGGGSKERSERNQKGVEQLFGLGIADEKGRTDSRQGHSTTPIRSREG